MNPISRRSLLTTGAALGGAALLARRAHGQPGHQHHAPSAPQAKPTSTPPPTPPVAPPAALAKGWRNDGTVITPNGTRMPWRVVDGVKVFHMVAGEVEHEFAPGLTARCWGYNGSTPGPTIEVTVGDRCRFYVTNRLAEPTTVHWHGVLLPSGMDGVTGVTQEAIPPGGTFRYEFTFNHPGTFMYHPHYDEMTQIALGMVGMIVVHPRGPRPKRLRDYALMLHEWQVPIGAGRPNPLAMSDFNVLTLNGKSFPSTAPLVAESGDTVRLRFGNLSPMDHHPMHIHGHVMRVVETDGGAVPPGARWPESSVLVPVGSVRVAELVAGLHGDWPLHCHMTHHVMNQMGHAGPNFTGAKVDGVDGPIARAVPGYMSMGMAGTGNMAEMKMPLPKGSISMMGAMGPFGYIDMGGMFTMLKVRDRLRGDGDPGWYSHPPGSQARAATGAELAADGVTVDDAGGPAQ